MSLYFSSNQKLEISGPLDHIEFIEEALKTALMFSGEINHTSKYEYDRGCRIVYQTTDSGSYAIGWAFVGDLKGSENGIPSGWKEYEGFMFDIGIVARMIKQYLENFGKFDFSEWNGFDGSKSKGFLMTTDMDDIREPFYGIVKFNPYVCYYAK